MAGAVPVSIKWSVQTFTESLKARAGQKVKQVSLLLLRVIFARHQRAVRFAFLRCGKFRIREFRNVKSFLRSCICIKGSCLERIFAGAYNPAGGSRQLGRGRADESCP